MKPARQMNPVQSMNQVTEHEFRREARRVFPRMMEPENIVARLSDSELALFAPRNKWTKPILRIESKIWLSFERRDLVMQIEWRDQQVWQLSEAGRAFWRRLEGEIFDDPFRAQHQLRASRLMKSGRGEIRVTVNDAETPLIWLWRRKGADGKPLISDIQLESGERLRRDYTLAGMDARVTTDWSFELGTKIRGGKPHDPAEVPDMALAARERLAHALREVGNGLANILIEVCCNQRGLEETERGFGWPRRSGKVVLQIALDRLAKHYAEAGARRSRYAPGTAASSLAASALTRSTIE